MWRRLTLGCSSLALIFIPGSCILQRCLACERVKCCDLASASTLFLQAEVCHRSKLAAAIGSPSAQVDDVRRHQDRGAEGCRELFSPPEGVSLLICSVGVSRSAAPRTGLRLGKLGRALRSFSKAFLRRSESCVVRSRVRSICSRCSSICCSRLSMYCSRSSRSSCIVPSPPYLLEPPGPL